MKQHAKPFGKFIALLTSLALMPGILTATASAQGMDEAIADAIGIPQIGAFLPDKYDVPETEALAIDGVWLISANRKKIRIEKGRAYAVDPWLHLFTLKIQPDMVVLQNFDRVAPGQYVADDLPLLGPAKFRLLPNGNMKVNVQGVLGPASYTLIKRKYDDNSKMQAELLAMKNGEDIAPAPAPAPIAPPAPSPSPSPSPQPNPDSDPLADCVKLDIDPNSGNIICLD
jgi:hypothetical protein